MKTVYLWYVVGLDEMFKVYVVNKVRFSKYNNLYFYININRLSLINL